MGKRIFSFIVLLVCMTFQVMAQKASVTGQLLEKSTSEPLVGATAVLLQQKDSVQVTGAVTDVEGKFVLQTSKRGNYILRLSYVGFITQYHNVTLTKENPHLDLSIIQLAEDAQVLKEAEVVARVAQVEVKADTFVYNSAAFRLPEGSALEELVRKLPGAEVEEDGTIKINGKEVKKIMVGGKEYFAGDNKMTMKNLPAKAVEKLKAYERKSDYARVTGIDDGEEETVLDLTVKKGMKDGWVINLDGGYGTEDRYAAKGNVNRFGDTQFLSIVGSFNNTNDQGFPGGGGRRWGGGGGGVVTSKMGGVTFAWDNGKKDDEAGLLKMGGNVRYSHSGNDNQSRSNSEMFLSSDRSTFSNNENKNLSRNGNLNLNFQFEWAPDTMTHIMFRPNFSYSHSDNDGRSRSATFNESPYKVGGLNDPLNEWIRLIGTPLDSILVNHNDRYTNGDGSSKNVDAWAQFNRRLGKPGRNVTFDVGGNYSTSENNNYSRSVVNLFRQDSLYGVYQNTNTPSKNYNIRGRLSYTEPLTPHWNLQGNYQFQYRFSDSDRTMMTFEHLVDTLIARGIPANLITAEGLYDGSLLRMAGLDESQMVRDMQNSQYATYREYNHDAGLMIRYNKGENRFNAGLSFQPQTTHMDYKRGAVDTMVVRHTFNWSPRLDYRWKISNVSQLRARFNGRMNQPSMTNLLEVVDNSDPLNVSTGNPGLRSSWTNRFNVDYNGYNTERQMGWVLNTWFSNTSNAITTATIYNRETGGRYSRPVNIDGNWNIGTWMMFNTALDQKKQWNIHTHVSLNHANNVGFLSTNVNSNVLNEDGTVNLREFRALFDENKLTKSITRNLTLNQMLRLNFRNDLFEIGANGSYFYNHARNDQQVNANMDTWTFNYGGNVQFNFKWGMEFASDISEQCRRGYDDATMNTNELIWNAKLSQSFLKKKAATISVEWYDILRQRSNISRNISATSRTDSWTNAIHSYLMVHFIYRLNLLGNKEMRGAMDMPSGGPGGPGGGRGPGGRGGRF